MESRTQGSRPRKQKKIRGQGQPFRGQTLSRPRTGMVKANDQGHRRKCSLKKKKVFKNFFSDDLQKKGSSKIFFRRSPNEENKKGLRKFFARFLTFSSKILTIQKIVLSSSRGQGNFRGQGRGSDLRGQGQGLQNMSLRPRIPPVVKYKDSTYRYHVRKKHRKDNNR